MATRVSRKQFLQAWAGLAVAGSAIALVSCGPFGKEAPAQAVKKTGKITAYLSTNDMVNGPRYFGDTVFARFEQQFPGIKVEPGYFGSLEMYTKVQVETAAGTMPDLFTFDQVQVPMYAAAGAVLDLSTWIKRDAKVLADVTTRMEYFTEPDGKVFGLPAMYTTSALVYNPALFDRFGVKYPDGNLTWNPQNGGTFLDLARKMTRADEQVYGFWTNNITSDHLSWLKQNSGSFFDRTRTKSDLLKAESIGAFEWMNDLVNRYGVSPNAAKAREIQGASTGFGWYMLQGKAAMMNFIISSESAMNLAQLANVRLAAVPLPRGARQASGSAGGPWVLYSKAKEPDLSWELLKWWANDEMSQIGVWTQWKWGLPPNRKVWTHPDVVKPRDHPLSTIQPFLEPLEKGYAAYHEVNPVWAQWLTIFLKHFNSAIAGEQGMRAAMEIAQPEIQALLDLKLPKT